MKQLKYLIYLMVAAVALSGCMMDEFDDLVIGEVQISTSIATRANSQGFEDGDDVGLYVVNYVNGNMTAGTLKNSGNQADHAQYTYKESNNKWVAIDKAYYKDEETKVDIYGFYPFDEPDSVDNYIFTVAQDQNSLANPEQLDGYEASDFLWAKAAGVIPTAEAVPLSFGHKMACAEVILSEGEGFEAGEFETLSRSVLATGVTRTASISLATGVATASGELSKVGTVMQRRSETNFRAIVVPQSVAAQVALFSITLDGVVYNFKKEEAFTYTAGVVSQFTIVVNKRANEGTYELELGDMHINQWAVDDNEYSGEARQYYTVEVQTAGTLGATLSSLNKDGARIKNLKVKGEINANDFFYMRDSMTVLEALNIQEVEVKGGGTYLDNEIPDNAFKEKSTLFHIAFPDGITRIGKNAFYHTNIVAAIIPNSVEVIDEKAFYNCSSLSSLVLPTSLKRIEDGAFWECSTISGQLNLPSGLEYIGNNAFTNCNKISGTLDLPRTLTYIGSWAFSNCGFIGSLKIPENVEVLYQYTFHGCNFNGELILHDNLKIEEGEHGETFTGCKFKGELVLPSTLVEVPKHCFYGSGFSSIAFPDGLKKIAASAFAVNWRLSGTLNFPDGVTTIGNAAFVGCGMINEIELGKELVSIGTSAFRDCYSITAIKCEALQPPVVSPMAFDGVSKNSFAIEVPERSVALYQQAAGWSDFARITAYKDFSIDKRRAAYLNAESTDSIYVRANTGASWSVDSLPNWITVSPMSGTGKMFVEVKASALSQGSADRESKVIFKLDGTNYTQTLKVEQYDYEYGDGDVHTLHSATVGNGVNIVIMGDCYDAADIASGQYLTNMTEAYTHLFDVAPYSTYKDYFNVHVVFGRSNDSGMGTVNKPKDAKFGCQYFAANGVMLHNATAFQYACKAPINNNVSETAIIIVPNCEAYGGICYMWGDGSSIAICPMSRDAYPFDFRGTVQHEVGGHGIGKLGDEYMYVNFWIDQCTCDYDHVKELRAAQAKGWYRNLSLTSDINQVAWAHLIKHPDYQNIVDVYEGGYFHTKNVWRSEPNTCMNNNVPYFSAISRQAIVERIMEIAGIPFTLADFYANDERFMAPSGITPSGAPRKTKEKPEFEPRAPKYMGEKPTF